MRRRDLAFGAVVGAVALSLPIFAKEPSRIAVLGSGSEDAPYSVNLMSWLRSGLGREGLVEGQDFVLEARWANGEYYRFRALAAELISKRPNAIVVSTIAAAEAAREVSTTVPIVMTGLNDPVGAGLASSLARPGGNVTGMATMYEEVVRKLVGLLPSALPKAKRITIMLNPTNPSNPVISATIEKEGARFGFVTEAVEVATPAGLDTAFEELRRYYPDLLLVVPDNSLIALSEIIVSRALAERVPTVGMSQQMSLAGAILLYGLRGRELVERTGYFLKRILSGVRPADLPIEQPTRFHLAVNLKIARTLGIEIPTALLVQADEVIE